MKHKQGILSVSLVGIIVVVLLLAVWINLATAQTKPIELRYSSPYMPPAVPYAVAAENWIKYVENETKGRVHITPYWGGALLTAKECIAELTKGASDVAMCSVYTEKGYEISWAMGTFTWNSPNVEVTYRVGRKIYEKFPSFQQEFPGLMAIGYRNTFPYILLTKKPINKLDDLKGLTICSGAPGTTIFPQFGSQVVKVPPSEWYSNLEKGIMDSIFIQLETLDGFKLAEVVKYVNLDIQLPTGAIPMTYMNLNSFNRLSADIQKVFINSIDFLEKEQLRLWTLNEQKGISYAQKRGVQFVKLPAAEKEKWQSLIERMVLEDAKKVDAVGKPGTEILKEAQQLIKQYSK